MVFSHYNGEGWCYRGIIKINGRSGGEGMVVEVMGDQEVRGGGIEVMGDQEVDLLTVTRHGT